MKYSKQRELIKAIIMLEQGHMTADDIYSRLKPSNPNLSLGTVYRNLNSLTESGIINKISIPSGSDRYDGNVREHYHAFCVGCGLITDVEYSLLDELDAKIESLTGMKIISHQLIVNGLCKSCQ